MAVPADSPPSAPPDVTRMFLRGVYTYMALGLLVTGIFAYVEDRLGLYAAIEKSPALLTIALAAPLAMVLLLSYRIERMTLTTAHVAFWCYAVLVGLSLSGIFEFYAGASIARTFFIAAATFAGMSAYGYATRHDLSHFGSLLLMGLVGLVIAGLVNLLFVSHPAQLAIEMIGIIVFVGLTAYDTQHIKELYRGDDDAVVTGKKTIIGALSLYLDFINLFLTLLQLRRWGFVLARHSHRMVAWSRLLASGEPRPKRTMRKSARAAIRWWRARWSAWKNATAQGR